jgi:hypothetical protein
VDPLGKTKAELFALPKVLFYGIKSNPLPVMTPGGKLVGCPGCASCHPNGEGSEVENSSCLNCHSSEDALKEKTLYMKINPPKAIASGGFCFSCDSS